MVTTARGAERGDTLPPCAELLAFPSSFDPLIHINLSRWRLSDSQFLNLS